GVWLAVSTPSLTAAVAACSAGGIGTQAGVVPPRQTHRPRLLAWLEDEETGGIGAKEEARSGVLLLQNNGPNWRCQTCGEVNKTPRYHSIGAIHCQSDFLEALLGHEHIGSYLSHPYKIPDD